MTKLVNRAKMTTATTGTGTLTLGSAAVEMAHLPLRRLNDEHQINRGHMTWKAFLGLN